MFMVPKMINQFIICKTKKSTVALIHLLAEWSTWHVVNKQIQTDKKQCYSGHILRQLREPKKPNASGCIFVDTLKENCNKLCEHSQGIKSFEQGSSSAHHVANWIPNENFFLSRLPYYPHCRNSLAVLQQPLSMWELFISKESIRNSKASLHSEDQWRCFSCSAHTRLLS